MSQFVNKGKCGKCGAILESKHRHDFVECGCGHFFIDGGTDYQRFGLDPKKEDPNSPTCLWDCDKDEWQPIFMPEPPKETSEDETDYDEIIPLFGEIK